MDDVDDTARAGGRRPGAGRPKGAKNKTTVAREASERAAALAVLAGMDQAAVENLMPLDILLIAARTEFQAGRFVQAASIAEKAAAYCHSKKAVEGAGLGVLPDDLRPQPAPTPDEPCPPLIE